MSKGYVVTSVMHLLPGDVFVAPQGEQWAGATFRIHRVRRAQRGRGVSVEILTKHGRRQVFPCMPELLVEKVIEIADSRVPGCQCRNHLGRRKSKYRTRDAAIRAILHAHIRFGEHGVYECPTEGGFFHVTSSPRREEI